MSRKFYITDVFAETAYAGNQLATLPDAAGLDGDEMQKIARAFNFAETTFITGGSLATGFDVRIFTPVSELPFAGHPTLGTSYLLKHVILESDASEITLNLGVGKIPVSFGHDGVLWMKQNAPAFGEVIDAGEVARNMGLDPSQIDARFPCQKVSTGLEFLIVPLRSYDALKAASPRGSELSNGHLLFCAGGYNAEQLVQARMFAGDLGVPEDPATGSANGCLAAYLAEHSYFGPDAVNVRVGQGYEINRPSQLYLRARKSGPDWSIEVGGRVNLVAEGEWLI